MNEMILLKLGEMVLKGLNRRSFEDKLQANIYRRLNHLGQFRVYTRQSATYVEPMTEECDMDGAWEALTKVFGVVGLSRARACDKDKDAWLTDEWAIRLSDILRPETFLCSLLSMSTEIIMNGQMTKWA